MKKSTEYAIGIVTFLVISIAADVIFFNSEFIKKLNVANAIFTAWVGLTIVVVLSREDRHNKKP